jgi:hypothetical protein
VHIALRVHPDACSMQACFQLRWEHAGGGRTASLPTTLDRGASARAVCESSFGGSVPATPRARSSGTDSMERREMALNPLITNLPWSEKHMFSHERGGVPAIHSASGHGQQVLLTHAVQAYLSRYFKRPADAGWTFCLKVL